MKIEKIVISAMMATLVVPFLFIPNDLGTEGRDCFEVETYETRITTHGGGISGSLAIKVYQPVEEGKYPPFVMCPGR